MKTIGNIILTLSALALLAAIWAPGTWWQWLFTAFVLLFIGAAIAGQHTNRDSAPQHDKDMQFPPATAVRNDTDRPERIVRPNYGRKADQ